MHQARAADVFGLVVGNVGLAASQPLLARLRADLKKHQKKSYTLSVGRLNPAKLANFMEVECFVLVGCAEGGVVDSKVCDIIFYDIGNLLTCARTSCDLSLRLGSLSSLCRANKAYGIPQSGR